MYGINRERQVWRTVIWDPLHFLSPLLYIPFLSLFPHFQVPPDLFLSPSWPLIALLLVTVVAPLLVPPLLINLLFLFSQVRFFPLLLARLLIYLLN